jgi:small-conductance mechanosensitive channel
MNFETAVNATPTVAAELYGLSGNLLAVLIVIAGAAIGMLLFITVGWIQKKADETESKLDDILIAALGTPMVIAVLVISIYFALRVATLPPGLEWIVESKYFNAIYIILGAWIASSFAYNFISIYGSRIAGRTESDIDDRMIALGLIVAKYIIWFVAFLLILSILEIDITPFLAGAGIIGLAVALAAQDILSNFFGGAMIAVDKPFKLHDRIMIDQYYGDVIHVGPRSTRLKTLDNQIVTIPNAKVVDSFIVNYAMPDTRLKVKIPVGVAYGSDVKRVKAILLEIANEMAERYDYILKDPEPSAYFLEFADSSLNFMLLVWTSDFSMIWDVQDAVNSRISERFADEGIEIPFPQMDVHLKKF